MRPDEFWEMTVFEWDCKYVGYLRKRNQVADQQAIYFRDTWAHILHAGGYRDEAGEPIKGEDLLQLPSEKKRRKRTDSLNPLLKMTQAERDDLRDRINRSAPQLGPPPGGPQTP